MRLTAYKNLVNEANKLPESLNNDYFKDLYYSPREYAIEFILNTARKDMKGLFLSELLELYEYTVKCKEKKE